MIGPHRLKQLEDENAKLRKVVADLSLDKGDASGRSAPKNLRPVRRRKLVDEMRSEWRVSIRRACRVFLLEAGKLQPPAIQRSVSIQTGTDSPYERGQVGEQVSYLPE
jgi:hypothetical protein